MDTLLARKQYPRMARRPKNPPKLYIGEWIEHLGTKKPSEIAKEAGITESYLSLLISGEKDNPAAHYVKSISEAMGVSMNALYSRPPTRDVTDQVTKLAPELLAAMQELLRGKK